MKLLYLLAYKNNVEILKQGLWNFSVICVFCTNFIRMNANEAYLEICLMIHDTYLIRPKRK